MCQDPKEPFLAGLFCSLRNLYFCTGFAVHSSDFVTDEHGAARSERNARCVRQRRPPQPWKRTVRCLARRSTVGSALGGLFLMFSYVLAGCVGLLLLAAQASAFTSGPRCALKGRWRSSCLDAARALLTLMCHMRACVLAFQTSPWLRTAALGHLSCAAQCTHHQRPLVPQHAGAQRGRLHACKCDSRWALNPRAPRQLRCVSASLLLAPPFPFAARG